MAISIFSGIELGFVFSDETELTDTQTVLYSIIKKKSESFRDKYLFRAITEDGKEDFELKLFKNNIYIAETIRYGNFYFQNNLINPIWNHYRGNHKNWNSQFEFSLLSCLNFQDLENASRLNNFIFIGNVIE